MTRQLCTRLPDACPTGWAERYLFNSAILSDWCHEHDLDDMHATFIAAGIPYSVQYVPPAIRADDGCDWGQECLTAAQRNSFSR